MAFCGQMHNQIGLVLRKQCRDPGIIANVDFFKKILVCCGYRGCSTGIGELVDVNDCMRCGAGEVFHKMAANEAGATCDENRLVQRTKSLMRQVLKMDSL